MTKLWEKGYTLNDVVERFMTGDDPLLDMRIAKYDCIASIVHAKMLYKIGVIDYNECEQLSQCLNEIASMVESGTFSIDPQDEDIHTAIENYLVNKIGLTGKKIHTARSRNDQVLTAIRLYTKDSIIDILTTLIITLKQLYSFTTKYKNIAYAGRTHYQKAMPSSIGLWMGAFIESLIDDAQLLTGAYNIINQSPLGSAASYGVNLQIDRQYCADLLGFAKVQNNVLYANNSRGKFDSIVLHALNQVMLDLVKLSTDIILFSAPEMGYVQLPQCFCPGSSIMPNKRNPDPFELIRAKSSTVSAQLLQVLDIIRALPSGYNRDFQETKRPLFEAIDTTCQSLMVMGIIVAQMEVNENACLASLTPEVFATDATLNMVSQGVAFRDAYLQVATTIDKIVTPNARDNILAKTHIGASGNLGLEQQMQHITQLEQTVATMSKCTLDAVSATDKGVFNKQ